MNNDGNYTDVKITTEYVNDLFNTMNIVVKKIVIENQEQIKSKLAVREYLINNTTGRSIHNKFNNDYVADLTNKLFFQFYGHYKVLECVDFDCNYEFIIKTRPDMFYKQMDMNLFKTNIFFPNSHLHNGCNINQLFFGGKTEYMRNILNFFEEVLFHNQNMNFEIIDTYHNSDINFNCLFRFYVLKHLNYRPVFTSYNPKIYRANGKMTHIT